MLIDGFMMTTLKENTVAFLFAFRAITYVWLAFASEVYMPLFGKLVTILRYGTMPVGIFYILVKNNKIKLSDCIALLPLLYYWLMLVFNTYGGYYGSYIHEVVSIGCFLVMDKKMKTKVFRYFYKIILYLSAVSILIYVMYILRIPIGFQRLPFYNDGVQTSYYQRWSIFAIVDSGYSIPRLCCVFNEPGGFGTVAGLLFAAVFHNSKKWEKCVLFFSILFSFSLAGYILMTVYLIIYLTQKKIRYALFSVGLIVFVLLIPKIDWHNDKINSFAQRFAITANGIAGDNRTQTSFDREYDKIIHSSDAVFGKGANYTEGNATSSYKNFIVQFGFVGFGIFLSLWLWAALTKASGNKDCFNLLFLFLISIYQRPVTLINTYGYVVVFGGFSWILNGSNGEIEDKLVGPTITV